MGEREKNLEFFEIWEWEIGWDPRKKELHCSECGGTVEHI